ncbi:hypothetical protein [Neisseria bacilliformis]|jgi:hypothetical protein|uniref:Uncharacterized protein n=1 Tax=Myoviridae sp. ctpjm1 TaxID=2826699 RepID=A0A8S5NPA8_9CAUD|nr:hypothetical protein [Neisseria bacilliformis]DAD96064.1 MAG TPA: hypothetical protein [Myoviridae sp. ctpjm1]DAS09544.1 MAG TPA: hypothetical protein [Bacteriophage sp.]
MTQQFRFGDMVKSRMHPNKTLGLVVDSGSNQYSYIIRWAHEKGVSQEHTESLEPVPHPDTVRLDWLLDKGAVSVGAAYTEDGDEIEGCVSIREHIYISDSEILGIGETARQAIDAAMREANHD